MNAGRRTLDLSCIVLPDRTPQEFVEQVQAAESAGVRTVWTYDHLSWRSLRDGPWHAALPLLVAAASCTSRVRLGTQVATPNFRHPVPLAKEIMTLDHISRGRVDLGVGAGAQDNDARVLGGAALSLRERADRFAEWVDLLDRVLTRPQVDYEGRYYQAKNAITIPGCVQGPRVPFTVAAAGPKGMRLAARHGQAWITYGPYHTEPSHEGWLNAVIAQSRMFGAISLEAAPGRRIRRIVQVSLTRTDLFADTETYRQTCSELLAAGFDEISVHWPRESGGGVPADRLDAVLEVHRQLGSST